MAKVTYFLEVISSWCHWVEPVWSELKDRYQEGVEFDWKVALMPAEACPVSAAQCQWFYRRSGTITRSPYMLNAGWLEPDIKQYLAPNYVALAARQMGVPDDRARLAIANAALLKGEKVGRFEVAARVAAEAARLDPNKLLAIAHSPEIAAAAEKTTAEFFALQVNQRPTFVIENSIGDRAVFSGIVRREPLVAAIDALLADQAAYQSWRTHFGDPPAK